MSFFGTPSMDKIGSRLASFVSSASEKVKEAAERTLAKETPLERNLREAVSDKNWGCATSVLSDIARASHSYSDFLAISKVMWDAIGEPPKRWKRIFKGLTLLEYMLKNGSEKFAEEARHKSYLLRMLQNFNWAEEGRDKGAGIREKAELCTSLVFDAEELKAAREQAAKNRDKFIGISSASSSMAYRSSSSSSSSGSHRATAAMSGLGSGVRHPTQDEGGEVRSSSRAGSSKTSHAGGPSSTGSNADTKHKTRSREGSSKKGRKKTDAAAAAAGSKPAASDKATAGEMDLLGFDSPEEGQQAGQQSAAGVVAFASGNDWADFTSAPMNASAPNSFAAFVPPPPPPPASAAAPSAAAAAAGGDDIFGGFQAATPPSAGPTGGNSLDAVAAAFAAGPQLDATTAGSPLTGTSPLAALNVAGPAPASGSPNSFQWQQQQSVAAAANGSSNSSSMQPQQQPFSMGSPASSSSNINSSNSNILPQPFSLSSSTQQQPFSLSNSTPLQQQQQQQQQQVFGLGGSTAPQPFSLSGPFPAASWQQQQPQQQHAAAAAAPFPPVDQGLF